VRRKKSLINILQPGPKKSYLYLLAAGFIVFLQTLIPTNNNAVWFTQNVLHKYYRQL